MPENEQDRKKSLLALLQNFLLSHLKNQGEIQTLIKGLYFARWDAPHNCSMRFSQPMAILFVQGEKRITLGAWDLNIRPGQYLVTCVETPSSSSIRNISPEYPYLSLHFFLDKNILTDLLSEMPPETRLQRPEFANSPVMDASIELIETFLRFAELTDRPERIPVLAPLILRELHYLLLVSPQGALLRDLYMQDAKDSRILDAINHLKHNLSSSISVENLAKMVNMSVSSLHRHFKNITGLSPLQYHKQLRLYEAQRLMLAENERADMAAMAVGYESITQFNREYKRMFGEPPHRDIMRRKNKIENNARQAPE